MGDGQMLRELQKHCPDIHGSDIETGVDFLQPTPHAIAVYASQPLSPVATQHSLPSGRYSLLGPDFHRQDRTSFAWRTYSITSSSPASNVTSWRQHSPPGIRRLPRQPNWAAWPVLGADFSFRNFHRSVGTSRPYEHNQSLRIDAKDRPRTNIR
jgi:hypothetical protein